ncbi:serine--tRNA ligase [Frankia sp. Ag45/Mut15]|uniref:Serine--tRNA ligase n=1 Tax=Frankia umida TaxID=573489 RepID=A0ABT0K455_9ACTN|nr:serine--tRNA ligase [Frankia umida]MCK9878554.1 serine--tRNA ligase [Frankia umida]
MHDVRELINDGPVAAARLARRGYELQLEPIAAAAGRRTAAMQRLAELRGALKRASRGSQDAARQASRQLRAQIQQAQAEVQEAERYLSELTLTIPNLPMDEVPDGFSEKEAVEIRRGGPDPVPVDEARHHALVGERLAVLDMTAAAKLSGARFSVARAAGARLGRALAALFLDLHTERFGYVELSVPYLVTRQTMTGTGQLPKFEDDLFTTRAGDRELILIPTAEVPLVNMYAGNVLDVRKLPIALTALSPCFRAEAGSYGRDSRGVLRLHQFEKVELVRICAVENARSQLELMLRHAEECLRLLELSYRVLLLPAGDLGFAARITYDLEVWLPGGGAYREISSVSDCGTFQSRRAGIRVRARDGGKGPVATLNGSALPIGRTIAALLEQRLQPDGSVLLPEALVPYAGFRRILPDGTMSREP